MAEKIARLVKWFKVPLFVVLGALWLISLVRAVNEICSQSINIDTSGWYQVIIELLGLPLLLYGLNELPKKLEESKWKPRISIGLSPGRPTLSEVRGIPSLPTSITVYPSQEGIGFWFTLIIRNYGELAARSVKLRIEVNNASFDDDSQFILWSDCGRIIPDRLGIDYIYPKDNGQQIVIYAGDEEVFRFPIQNRRRDPPNISVLPLRFSFCCMIWADGINLVAKEDLTIEVANWEAPSNING